MSSWLSSLGDTIKNSSEDLTRGVQGKETGRAESVVVTFEGSALGLTVSDHGGEGVLSMGDDCQLKLWTIEHALGGAALGGGVKRRRSGGDPMAFREHGSTILPHKPNWMTVVGGDRALVCVADTSERVLVLHLSRVEHPD